MSDDLHYDDRMAGFLEDIWGPGYLSPGGPEEVARVLEGLDLTGKRVMDIGCGTGAITLSLVQDHGAAEAVGIDVEEGVVAEAQQRMQAEGLAERVSILQVEPGPFPFGDQGFDLVFSKDSIIHIPDKEALAAEIFRVLKPGGWFAASDWLISHDDDPSPDMAAYIKSEDLDFAMASPARYAAALKAAGFAHVETRNRNGWYRDVARDEYEQVTSSRKAEFEEKYGRDFNDQQITTWTMMLKVLETGEHCPHHLRGQRPE